MRRLLKATAACVLAAGLTGGSAQAAGIYHVEFTNLASASLKHSYGKASENKTTTASSAVGPFTTTPPAYPTDQKFETYCASLDISNPSGPQNIYGAEGPLYSMTKSGNDNDVNGVFRFTNYNDAGNRLAFLLEQIDAVADGVETAQSISLSVNERKVGLQLAIWNAIDKNFSYSNLSGSGINASDIGKLYTALTTFTGYNAGTTYGLQSVFLDVTVTDKGKPFQDLVGINPNVPPSVPEPASVVTALIGLGGAGLLAGRRARRGRA